MASDGIMTGVEVKHPAGAWPSGKATDFESFALASSEAGDLLTSTTPQPSGLHWAFFPDWLSIDQACFLSGLDARLVAAIADDGGIELDPDGQIEKRSLWDFLEALALVLHWHE